MIEKIGAIFGVMILFFLCIFVITVVYYEIEKAELQSELMADCVLEIDMTKTKCFERIYGE